MDPSKENNFEDQWREIFKGASETPPESIWARLEAHLDEEEDKIVPLIWWRSPKVWFAAASIAALLIAGGVYLNPQNFHASEGISQENISKKGDNEGVATASGSATTVAQEETVSAESEEKVLSAPAGQNGNDIALVEPDKNGRFAKETGSGVSRSKVHSFVFKDSKPVEFRNEIGENISSIKVSESGIYDSGDLIAVTETKKPAEARSAYELAMLSPSAAKELDVYMQKRYVFFKQQSIKEEQAKKKDKEYWAALSFMPSAFNPDLKVNSAPQGFATGALANAKSTRGSSETGTSFAYQSMGGMNISKHWSVEMGLSYLQGNSTYEGGGYLLSSVYNGRAANVLESAYADLNNKNGQAAPGNPYQGLSNGLNSVYIDVSKNIQNNYQYLQLPVQAGYTLNPQGKLSYGILGGVMTNFFLKNEIESANGYTITTTPSDDVYKSVNLAATTGLRLSYRFSQKWKANLTGSYQKSLNSAIKSNQSIDAHPYLYGVSWGVRYTF